jgi:hypothetical protein
MLIIEHVGETLVNVPGLVRLGLFGLLVAGLADVVAHLGVEGGASTSESFSAGEIWAHVGVLVSMVLVFVGVVVDGVRQGRVGRLPVDGPAKGVE